MMGAGHRAQWVCQRAVGRGRYGLLWVARFNDASIYRDTFPAIRIAILFFYNHNFFYEFFL